MAVNLTDGTKYGDARSIIVTGNDVYVGGSETDDRDGDVTKYWKNGLEVNINTITDGDNYGVTSICVSEKDVHIIEDYYTYWKNGQPISLTGTNNSIITNLYVYNNDVYVTGGEMINGILVAKYWKNGKSVTLSDGKYNEVATAACVSGGDIYISGVKLVQEQNENSGDKTIIKYWKNGQSINLTDGTTYAFTKYIHASGSDVYVGGYEYNPVTDVETQKYWKNGKATNIANSGGDGFDACFGVFNTSNDIYVAGYEENTNGIRVAKYWKNGTSVSLTDGKKDAKATAIFVVAK